MHREKHMMGSSIEAPKSPLDLWRLMGAGGKAHRVQPAGMPRTDSLLAVFKDHFTYTFILGRDVASIHFDRGRGEIFFRGHNIRNMELDADQRGALKSLKNVLENDKRGEEFLKDYDATLGRFLADNK